MAAEVKSEPADATLADAAQPTFLSDDFVGYAGNLGTAPDPTVCFPTKHEPVYPFDSPAQELDDLLVANGTASHSEPPAFGGGKHGSSAPLSTAVVETFPRYDAGAIAQQGGCIGDGAFGGLPQPDAALCASETDCALNSGSACLATLLEGRSAVKVEAREERGEAEMHVSRPRLHEHLGMEQQPLRALSTAAQQPAQAFAPMQAASATRQHREINGCTEAVQSVGLFGQLPMMPTQHSAGSLPADTVVHNDAIVAVHSHAHEKDLAARAATATTGLASCPGVSAKVGPDGADRQQTATTAASDRECMSHADDEQLRLSGAGSVIPAAAMRVGASASDHDASSPVMTSQSHHALPGCPLVAREQRKGCDCGQAAHCGQALRKRPRCGSASDDDFDPDAERTESASTETVDSEPEDVADSTGGSQGRGGAVPRQLSADGCVAPELANGAQRSSKRARVELPEGLILANNERWCGICASVKTADEMPAGQGYKSVVQRCNACIALMIKGTRCGLHQSDVIDAIRDGNVQQLFARFRTRTHQRDKHRNAGLDLSKEQRCGLCCVVRPLEQYHVNTYRKSGRNLLCKICQQVTQRGHRMGLTLRELRQHFEAGTLVAIKGLMLPHLERGMQSAEPPQLELPPAGYKRCAQCLEVKELDSFVVNAACDAAGKRGDFCRRCWHIRFNARKQQMTLDEVHEQVAADAPEAQLSTETERQCRFCLHVRPISLYNKNKATKGGFNLMCRPCSTLKMRAFKLTPRVTTEQLRSAMQDGTLDRIPGLRIPLGFLGPAPV